MKSIVVLTYWQLMHSIALSLTLEEKPNLYVAKFYAKFDEERVNKIRETNLFNEVIEVNQVPDINKMVTELKNAKKNESIDIIKNSIFEKYLEPYYGEIFDSADYNDDIFIYNDFQWYYYFIIKHFNNVIGIEDGYKILKDTQLHEFNGIATPVIPFVGKYYPKANWKEAKVKKIISSCSFEHEKEVLVLDFFDLINKNNEAFKNAILSIFGMRNFKIESNSSLILGQPLDRREYCNAIDHYLFFRKLIAEERERGNTVYLKPHPAEQLNFRLFEDDKVKVLPYDFPIEILNYQQYRFNRGLAFSSTSLETTNFIDEVNQLFNKENASKQDINKFINQFINNEKVVIQYYIKVRDLNPMTYMNVMGYLNEGKKIKNEVFVIVDENINKMAVDFFKLENFSKMLKRYKKEKKTDYTIWENHILKLRKKIKKTDSLIKIISLNGSSDLDVYKKIIRNQERMDFFMIIESSNNGFEVTQKINNIVKNSIRLGQFFFNYSVVKDKIVPLGTGAIKGTFSEAIGNRLWHRHINKKLNDFKLTDEEFFSKEIAFAFKNEEKKHTGKRLSLKILVTEENYIKLPCADEYYQTQLNNLYERYMLTDNKHLYEDFLVKQIALILEEYENYMNINHGNFNDEVLTSMLETSNIEPHIIERALVILYHNNLRERNFEYVSSLYKYKNMNTRLNKQMTWLVRHNFVRLVKRLAYAKKKLKKIIKGHGR